MLTVPREAERVKEGRVGARVGHFLFAPCRLSVESFTARGYLMHTQSSDASSGVVCQRQTRSNPPNSILPSNLAVEAGDEAVVNSGERITSITERTPDFLLHVRWRK